MPEATMRLAEKKENTAARRTNRFAASENHTRTPTQQKECKKQSTGSGFDNVHLRYTSDLPARPDALTYTRAIQMKSGSGQKSHLPHMLGHMVQQKLRIVRAGVRNVTRNEDVARDRQANDSSTEKRTSIIQRIRNNVVQRCGFIQSGVGNTNIPLDKFTKNDVPSVKDGKFNDFFDSLSNDELDALWRKTQIREAIESRLRSPGRYHEWLLVSRTPIFKSWGITAAQIKSYRTLTRDVKFVNPEGRHGGPQSTTAHNELLRLIDTSTNFEDYKRKLNAWANNRLSGGAKALPMELQV